MKAYKVTIRMTDVEPVVWREVMIPYGATFQRLHFIIQRVTNFQSWMKGREIHFFEVSLPEENMIVTDDPFAYEKFKRRKKSSAGATVRQPQTLKIDVFLEKYGKLHYTYDFGDDWRFDIVLDEIVDDYHFGYPLLIAGSGEAPPEDSGGPPGFAEFLKIIADDKHPEQSERLFWAKEQGYERYDHQQINGYLKDEKIQKTEWHLVDHDNYRILSDKYHSVEYSGQVKRALRDTTEQELLWQYIKACTNLYGVVTVDHVLDVFNRQNPKIYMKIGEALAVMRQPEWKKRMAQSEVDERRSEFTHAAMESQSVVDSIVREQQGKDWYIPEKNKLLLYADELYIEPTQPYIALRKELQPKHPKLHPLSFEEAMYEVKLAIQLNDSPIGYVNFFFGVFEPESEKEMKKHLDLLMHFANNLRLWANRGHQPIELRPKENLRPLPDNVIPFSNALRAGRNDPCPCGSGKKYKKCCGK